MSEQSFNRGGAVKRAAGFVVAHIRVFIVGLIVGVVLGLVGPWLISRYATPTDSSVATTIFSRIAPENELVSVSQRYAIVDKATSTNQIFGIDIPFTTNSFWYRYEGTLKAGVRLTTADVSEVDKTITITLDPAYIISNEPDMTKSGVLEENNNVLNPIHVQDVDAFQRRAKERSEQEALEGGILKEAQTEAQEHLSELFYAALGDDYTVNIVFRDAPVQQ